MEKWKVHEKDESGNKKKSEFIYDLPKHAIVSKFHPGTSQIRENIEKRRNDNQFLRKYVDFLFRDNLSLIHRPYDQA